MKTITDEARVVTVEGTAHFRQGSIEFEVDPTSLERTLGVGPFPEDRMHGSVIDRLSDASIVALALANHLDVDPYVRELLREPLNGVIQIAWKVAFDPAGVTDYLLKNQANRVALYRRRLEERRNDPVPIAPEAKKKKEDRRRKFIRVYRVARGVRVDEFGGRERAIINIVNELKAPTFAQIIEAAAKKDPNGKTRVATKSDLSRVVTYFVNSLTKRGIIEMVDEQLKLR